MSEIQVEINGVSHTFKEWAEMTGIDEGTLKCRYYRGHKNLIAAVRKRESVLLLTINGETHTTKEWSEISGISQKNIRNRFDQREFTKVIHEKGIEIEINGELHTLREWSEITGISVYTLRSRYNTGATAAEFLKPTRSRKERLK